MIKRWTICVLLCDFRSFPGQSIHDQQTGVTLKTDQKQLMRLRGLEDATHNGSRHSGVSWHIINYEMIIQSNLDNYM
jgi:hypothetical protein